MSARVGRFAQSLQEAIRSSGLIGLCPSEGPLVGLYLSRDETTAPSNFDEAKVLCDNGLYRTFFHALLERGVAFAPGAYEILFVSLAHSDDDLAMTVAMAAEAAEVAARS